MPAISEKRRKYNAEWRVKNHARVLARAAEYRKRPEVIERMKKWREDNREKLKERHQEKKHLRREYRLKKRYGLSKEEFVEIVRKQKGLCAICPKPLSTSDHIDHCHGTGKVRGVLCRSCNLLLGYSYDNIRILLSAIKYLKRNG